MWLLCIWLLVVVWKAMRLKLLKDYEYLPPWPIWSVLLMGILVPESLSPLLDVQELAGL